MAREINVEPSKTYKTKENMEKAIKGIPDFFKQFNNNEIVRYITCQTEDGRFYPVFVGVHLVHLTHQGFCVIS